jgi:arylsulfatase
MRNQQLLQNILIQLLVFAFTGSVWAASEFKGVVGKLAKDSTPYWPAENQPHSDAPNILIWMIDDAGFGHINNFGGLVETPGLDNIANAGLRFTNFHSTALCSPSRASLLAGRNHHAIGMGAHANTASGFPGYNARIPKSAASIAQILKDKGYATYALGKWDHLPAEHTSPLGPFDYWPSGQGFEHFYGFTAYDNHHFTPTLWRDHSPLEIDLNDPDYHLTSDIANQAIDMLRTQHSIDPAKPFFMYWATGAVHAPHHAPDTYLEKYRGKFDQGWHAARQLILDRQKKLGIVPADAQLPPWPADVPRWETLNTEQQGMAARAMEAFAAMLDHTDAEFGRIIEALTEMQILNNTIVVVVSDNGASAEGGLAGSFNELLMGNVDWEENLQHFDSWGRAETYPHYPVGWAAAGNTPFKYYKQSAHEGGTRVPMLISWQKGISDHGGLRQQFHHINDIVPTLLDMAGIAAPEQVAGVKQQPMDGVSFSYALDNADAPTNKPPQYFELWGNHGIWADGWKAAVLMRPKPWDVFSRVDYENPKWELYHLAKDFNERIDVAGQYPEKLAEMQALFEREATRNNVYPIGPDALKEAYQRLFTMLKQRNNHFEYYPSTERVPGVLAPPINLFAFTGEVQINKTAKLKNNVVYAYGGAEGGMALYVENNKPVFAFNNVGRNTRYIKGKKSLPSGQVYIGHELKRTGRTTGILTLSVNGEPVAQGELTGLGGRFPTHETFDVGVDSGSTVVVGYEPMPIGVIQKVAFDIELPKALP